MDEGDFNSLVDAGAYMITGNGEISNRPDGSYRFGVLLVFSVLSTVLQVYFPDKNANDFISYRMRYDGGTWRPWVSVK